VPATSSAPYSEQYLEGIRLFNAEHFWHAHEQWEACWLASDEPDATFYKGIIQAAAALVHWQKGNPRGLHLNWAKSLRKLETLPSPYQGLDLLAFRATMEAFIAAQEQHPSPPVPRLHLLDTARLD
jgi:hypothetical protein